jgi:hypothetical protein
MKFEERVQKILRTLSLLLTVGCTAELRVPRAEVGALVGLFDDLDEMARSAAEYSGKAPGIYFLLNQLDPTIIGPADNRVSKATSAVKDEDIVRRRWLLVDFDPVRPTSTPSTDLEHQAAIALAKKCRTWLRDDQDWPEPVLADSGNGAHLLYRIDLPNDESCRRLMQDCLEVLALKFSDAKVSVDVANFNASRLCRVYGTMNRKGESSDERPYRRANLLNVPDEIELVSRRQLRELASMLPVTSRDSRKEQLNVALWIERNNVPVLADAPWKNGGHKWVLQCPWNELHNNRSAYIVQFPDGGVAAGCLHTSCEENDWPALRARFEERSGGGGPQVEFERDKVKGEVKQRFDLLGLSSEIELFRTPQGEAYGSVPIKGHFEHHPIKSRAFEDFLRYRYFSVTGSAPRPQDVRDATSHFMAVAMFDSPTKSVHVRVAAAGGLNYLDLCDGQWRAVQFDPAGWRVVAVPEIKFRRAPGMLPLPIPVRGGNINDLRKFLNFRTEDEWILFITDLLQALLPTGPYPVLGLHGEAGSAKTTGSRVFRMMVDPNTSPARAMPRDIRDLAIAANNSWVLIFDNLSYLPPWFSDCLCRMSTGGGFTTRQLYTDADEILFDGQRPIILNGAEELASRTDLVDRSIVLVMKIIETYTQEREFWTQFEEAQPRLLGALLDMAVKALGELGNVRLSETPRMADFATFATAAESGLGLSTGAFMTAYIRNRQDAHAVSWEASPIASVIFNLTEKGYWEGTAEELLGILSTMADDELRKSQSWPKNPRALSGILRRLATGLRRAGIDVEMWRENDRPRTRMISIQRRGSKNKDTTGPIRTSVQVKKERRKDRQREIVGSRLAEASAHE